METREFIQDIINNELTGCFSDCSQDNIDKLVEILDRHHQEKVKTLNIFDGGKCNWCGKHIKPEFYTEGERNECENCLKNAS